MKKDFKYLEVPASLKPFIGEPDPDTRIYRREGSDEESGPWFDALGEHLPGEGFVSPGAVMMYAPVSRAAVHKRLKEGKMTAFCFHVIEAKRSHLRVSKEAQTASVCLHPGERVQSLGRRTENTSRPQRGIFGGCRGRETGPRRRISGRAKEGPGGGKGESKGFEGDCPGSLPRNAG